jgi:hypothetical protein
MSLPYPCWKYGNLTLPIQWAQRWVALFGYALGLCFYWTECGILALNWVFHFALVWVMAVAPLYWYIRQFPNLQVFTISTWGNFHCANFVGKCSKVIGSVHSAWIFDGDKFPLCVFYQSKEPPCLCFCHCGRNDSGGSWFCIGHQVDNYGGKRVWRRDQNERKPVVWMRKDGKCSREQSGEEGGGNV